MDEDTDECSVMFRHEGFQRRIVKMEFFNCELTTLEMLQCESCDFSTGLKVSLTEHVRVLHEEKQINQDLNSILKNSQCKKCDFETYSLIVLSKHLATCENRRFRKKFRINRTRRKYKVKLPKENDKWYEFDASGVRWRHCKHCDYKTSNKSCMYTHQLTRHTDPKDIKWFKCERCSFQAKLKSNLSTHMMAIHASPKDIKWFYCEHCEFKTKQKFYLKKHFQLMHTGTRSKKKPQREPVKIKDTWVKCEQCDFETRTKRQLKEHILRKHTGGEYVTWFKCGQCSFKATATRTLRAHVCTFAVCSDTPK